MVFTQWTALRFIHVDAHGRNAAVETSASVDTREEQVMSPSRLQRAKKLLAEASTVVECFVLNQFQRISHFARETRKMSMSEVLKCLMSSDNAVRAQAEAMYNDLRSQNVGALMNSLLTCLHEPQVRSIFKEGSRCIGGDRC